MYIKKCFIDTEDSKLNLMHKWTLLRVWVVIGSLKMTRRVTSILSCRENLAARKRWMSDCIPFLYACAGSIGLYGRFLPLMRAEFSPRLTEVTVLFPSHDLWLLKSKLVSWQVSHQLTTSCRSYSFSMHRYQVLSNLILDNCVFFIVKICLDGKKR